MYTNQPLLGNKSQDLVKTLPLDRFQTSWSVWMTGSATFKQSGSQIDHVR